MNNKSWLAILMGVVLIAILVPTFIVPIMQSSVATTSVGAATNYLESRGYVVFTQAQYDAVAKEATAVAAVVNAEAAALAAQGTLDTLLLHNENEMFLYPTNCTVNVTLTAGIGVDTWGAWAEITDGDAVTLSSKFAADDGYLVEIMTHDYSIADKIYMIEISYGAAKTVVGRVKVRSDWTYVNALRSVVIPAGETIYYRMQSETSGASLQADFRYYLA